MLGGCEKTKGDYSGLGRGVLLFDRRAISAERVGASAKNVATNEGKVWLLYGVYGSDRVL